MRYFFILLLLLSSSAHAVQTSRPSSVDSRLRILTYSPNGIHKYTGFYEFQASILFEKGETIKTISMGKPSAWQIIPSGSRMFIKPVEDDAETNMLIITNRRSYHFILEAKEAGAGGIESKEMVFETQFIYPDSDQQTIRQYSVSRLPDLTDREKYNFNYTVSGSTYIAPLRVFDDGEFTYFEFPEKNAEIPTFFLVDSEGKEGLVNYRIMGDKYIVIERVTSQFTLRNGVDATCVFNEARPQRKIKLKR